MYNLLVKGNGWNDSRDEIDCSRVFEHTEDYLKDQFKTNDGIEIESLIKLPCLFMQETWHDGSQQNARVGIIINTIKIEYAFDSSIAPLTNEQIQEISGKLGINRFVFSITHWH